MNYNKAINIINNCIYYIIEYGYSYNTKDIFNNYNDNDLEFLLNYYLLSIKKRKKYNTKLVNSINKHFININISKISNEIDIILERLLSKDKRHINITHLKEYTINSTIHRRYMDDIMISLIIKLAIINYLNLELKI